MDIIYHSRQGSGMQNFYSEHGKNVLKQSEGINSRIDDLLPSDNLPIKVPYFDEEKKDDVGSVSPKRLIISPPLDLGDIDVPSPTVTFGKDSPLCDLDDQEAIGKIERVINVLEK